MQNGTARFNKVESYIIGLNSKRDQEVAISYYSSLLNHRPFNFYTLSFEGRAILQHINDIMYKVF